MQIDLHKSFQFTPTLDQSGALDQLNRFINSKTPLQLFILRGFAGTGKTSLLAHIAKSLQKVNKVVLMAPTGRAAKVLSSYCGLPAFTVHKKIYWLKDSGEGDMRFILQNNKYKDTIFIVDEASMLSTGNGGDRDVLEDLMRFVYRSPGCKIIMSGDNAQLPPVDMSYSPALDKAYMMDRFRMEVDEIELNTVIRQAQESGILLNATALRESLQTENYEIKFQPNSMDVVSISGMELQESLEASISEYGLDEVLIITRSNKRANQFNNEVRNRMLFREDNIAAGDVLMSVKNNYHWLKQEENKEDFIANGESFEVLKVWNKDTMHGFDYADVNVRFLDNRIPDVDLKVWLNSLNVEGPAMPISDVRDVYFKVYQEYLDLGEGKKAKDQALNDGYYNAVQVKFSYAVTCHKAQGGQWSAVFIDHGFLLDDMVDENLLRWFYTAITRAKERVYLVNFNKQFLVVE